MNYAIDLTPYVLVRICNESVEHLLLGAESGASLAQHLTACQQAQDAFDADRSLLVNALFDYMRTCTDARQQQQIQEVRRCLFNKRALKRKDVEIVGTYLPDSLATRLAACYATEQTLAEQRQAFAQQHTAVLAATRQQLNQRYASELFQQGLLLSSLTLQANSRRLISADPASLRKDDLQVENGLLRYYTRMSTKTSPYSTFSSVQFAKADRPGGFRKSGVATVIAAVAECGQAQSGRAVPVGRYGPDQHCNGIAQRHTAPTERRISVRGQRG